MPHGAALLLAAAGNDRGKPIDQASYPMNRPGRGQITSRGDCQQFTPEPLDLSGK
jgi:hypothetical protein